MTKKDISIESNRMQCACGNFQLHDEARHGSGEYRGSDEAGWEYICGVCWDRENLRKPMEWTPPSACLVGDGQPSWRLSLGDHVELSIVVSKSWHYEWSIRVCGSLAATGPYFVNPSGQADEDWSCQMIEEAQAACVAVVNGILLRKIRSEWGDPRAYVEPNGDEIWALCVSRGKGRCIVATAAPTETEALLKALKMEAP